MKRMALVLLLTLPASFTPASSADCTILCDPSPLQIWSSNVHAKKLAVAVFNPTSEWQSGSIRGVVQSGGKEILFQGVINARPNSVTIFQATFERPIHVVSCLTLCENYLLPGLNEGPDPIAVKFEEIGGGGESGEE